MKTQYLISFFLALFLSSCSSDSNNNNIEDQQQLPCEQNNITTDSFHLSNQTDIENFLNENPSEVGYIKVVFQSDLSFLNCIKKISTLWIDQCTITNFEGLSNLEELGTLRITDCDNLINLQGIGQIPTLDNLTIKNCENITSLQGLETLSSLNYNLEIKNNDSLLNLDGLSNISSISDTGNIWNIENNDSLSNIYGINNVSTSLFPQFSITSCSSLTDLGTFNNITNLSTFNVSGSNSLLEINCFPNVSSANYIKILGSPQITNISFPSINEIGYLSIVHNSSLTNLNFTQLTELFSGSGDFSMEIDNNDSLETLSGFQNLVNTAGIIEINTSILNQSENPLKNICNIRNLILQQINNGTFDNRVEYRTACDTHIGLHTDISDFDESCNCN